MSTDPLVKRLKRLVSHIEHVQAACKKVAEGLIDQGDFGTAKELIRNSLSHDASKFDGREWEKLNDGVCDADDDEFHLALEDHVTRNRHHPAAWELEYLPGLWYEDDEGRERYRPSEWIEHKGRGIHRMSRACVIEMVCDWQARASESGTDLREGITKRAMPRFGFDEKDEVWKTIEETLGYLLEPRLN